MNSTWAQLQDQTYVNFYCAVIKKLLQQLHSIKYMETKPNVNKYWCYSYLSSR